MRQIDHYINLLMVLFQVNTAFWTFYLAKNPEKK